MRFSAVAAITNNLVAARFWMILALLFAGMAVASPYFTAIALRAREKVVILDSGGARSFMRRCSASRRPAKADNTPVASQATQAKPESKQTHL